MQTVYHLSQLMASSQCQFKVYDLSRRVQLIDKETFLAVEQSKQAYPYPMQQHAHLAICYWHLKEETQAPWFWFLKFPLDERGLLSQTDIQNFLNYVIAALGVRLGAKLTEKEEDYLAKNPYTFTPSEDKMGVFHSLVANDFDQTPSSFYLKAQQYFANQIPQENWQEIGFQGICDVCVRLKEDQNLENIQHALSRFSTNNTLHPVLYALLGVLEHLEIPEKIALTIKNLYQNELKRDQVDLFLIAAYIRALAGHLPSLTNVVADLLQYPSLCHQEVLIAIAGRSWRSLSSPQLAQLYLLRLAQTGNQTLFNQIFADLVMIPELRISLLPLIHQTTSDELGRAFSKMIQSNQPSARTH